VVLVLSRTRSAASHELSLPTRPATATGTRAAGFDGESAEVDAIPAPGLRRIVGRAIKSHIDRDAPAATMRRIEKGREILASLAGQIT
jgi:hypothetical protein